MRLERDSFKTEWGASPRAQGTVMLLWEISQTRAVMNSQHTPEADVRARERLQGVSAPLALPVPADWPRCESAAFLMRAFENRCYDEAKFPKNEHG